MKRVFVVVVVLAVSYLYINLSTQIPVTQFNRRCGDYSGRDAELKCVLSSTVETLRSHVQMPEWCTVASFLGSFAKLRKATVSFVVCVCPSA
jgi:hypothetical protein